MIDSKVLENLFNTMFSTSYKTLLCGGADEPIYYPLDENNSHARIYYRNDYVSSALHEVAHWTIAGQQRRNQVDYGYWYAPDERDIQQQNEFFSVEIKPQALEAIFSESIGLNFSVSLDNINSQNQDETNGLFFEKSVEEQKKEFLKKMPKRAHVFNQCLISYMQTNLDKTQ